MTAAGRHCSPEELVDLVDGTTCETAVPHLASCPSCHEQLGELRRALVATRRDAVPEPSPLFWPQLAARIHEAVATERHVTRATSAGRWSLTRSRWWFAAPAAAAVVLVVTTTWSVGQRSASTPSVAEHRAASDAWAPAADVMTFPPGDASLTWMADLASRLDQEAIESVGLATASGATDSAFAELSSEEQQELERLLREEMTRP